MNSQVIRDVGAAIQRGHLFRRWGIYSIISSTVIPFTQ